MVWEAAAPRVRRSWATRPVRYAVDGTVAQPGACGGIKIVANGFRSRVGMSLELGLNLDERGGGRRPTLPPRRHRQRQRRGPHRPSRPPGFINRFGLTAVGIGHFNGDVVGIADGTHRGGGHKNLNFDGEAIMVRSASGDPALRTIDCEVAGRGFHILHGKGPDSIVEGLTITNAYHIVNGGGVYRFGSDVARSPVHDELFTPTVRRKLDATPEKLILQDSSRCRADNSSRRIDVLLLDLCCARRPGRRRAQAA